MLATPIIHQRILELRMERSPKSVIFRGGNQKKTIDAKNLHVLPGIIDSQVHFREPGNEHKEDMKSGSKAAVLGGVTSVFEMPNTQPSTTNIPNFNQKLSRAQGRYHCDFGFFIGACKENISDLSQLENLPGCVGVKIFMGSSTGHIINSR